MSKGNDPRPEAGQGPRSEEQLVAELHEAKRQLSADLNATQRLLAVGSLFLRDGNLKSVLGEIIDAAIAITGADFGNIRLLDERTGSLAIVVARGFPESWRATFASVDEGFGSCGAALARKERLIIEDLETSSVFAGTPGPKLHLEASVRAVQSTPFFGRGGNPLGVLSTHYRTPTKPSPNALQMLDLLVRQAADILERARSESALEEANKRLREADRRKDEFLAILSHELRNPLAPVSNALSVLGAAEPGSESARRAQAVIERQFTHLSRLTDDLLDVTRITRGTIELRRQVLDVSEIARQTVDDHRAGFVERGVTLELLAPPPPEPIHVEGDDTRLAQIIANLLQNAMKFTPRGGKTIVSIEARSGQAIIRVRDTGTGITPEFFPRLFETFTQGESQALDRRDGGLGLGLPLAQGLVALHGGTLEAKSDGPGRGSTFTVSLPLSNAKPPAAIEHSRARARPRRVLVIDDNMDSADMLRQALELRGHQVEVAHSGPEGVEKLRQLGAQVVICDIGLPEMDGYAVARAMRADPKLHSVRLVALTGYARPQDVTKAIQAGFDAHLAKPAGVDLIERALDAEADA